MFVSSVYFKLVLKTHKAFFLFFFAVVEKHYSGFKTFDFIVLSIKCLITLITLTLNFLDISFLVLYIII